MHWRAAKMATCSSCRVSTRVGMEGVHQGKGSGQQGDYVSTAMLASLGDLQGIGGSHDEAALQVQRSDFDAAIRQWK